MGTCSRAGSGQLGAGAAQSVAAGPPAVNVNGAWPKKGSSLVLEMVRR